LVFIFFSGDGSHNLAQVRTSSTEARQECDKGGAEKGRNGGWHTDKGDKMNKLKLELQPRVEKNKQSFFSRKKGWVGLKRVDGKNGDE
jgi:hypothetical protein